MEYVSVLGGLCNMHLDNQTKPDSVCIYQENEPDQIVFEPYTMVCTGENAVYWVIGVVVIKSVVIIVGAFLTWPSW